MKRQHFAGKECQAPHIRCQSREERDDNMRNSSDWHLIIGCQSTVPSRVRSRARGFAPLRGRSAGGMCRPTVRDGTARPRYGLTAARPGGPIRV